MHVEDLSLPRSLMAARRPSGAARLIEQVRMGDAEAGRRFIHEHYAAVYRFLLCRTGRPEVAADLTQETFVQAWRSLDTFDAGRPVRPWLLRIAYRELLQALRRERPTASLADIAELPEPRAGALAEAVELREVLRKLPLEEREVVVLHYLEGYRCEEIADSWPCRSAGCVTGSWKRGPACAQLGGEAFDAEKRKRP